MKSFWVTMGNVSFCYDILSVFVLSGAESVHSNGGQCFADNKAYLNDEASSHIEICVTKDANDSAAEIA